MEVLLSAEQIQGRVAELGRRISADHGQEPLTIVGVLTGSLMFLADLVRQLPLPVRIDFIQASSYRGASTTASELRVGSELAPDVRDRHVLLIDDILDTGQTLSRLVEHFQTFRPLSLRTAVLLRKLGRQVHPFEPDYVGFEIPDRFVVGYGLDYNDEYRNLPYIGVLDNLTEVPPAQA